MIASEQQDLLFSLDEFAARGFYDAHGSVYISWRQSEIAHIAKRDVSNIFEVIKTERLKM
jgi:hypothetical protein